MFVQDILRYVGMGLLGLSVVLFVLSAVVFVTRDVRGALRFLRGGPASGPTSPTGEHRVMAMHRSRAVTRATRESLAEVEAGSGVRSRRSVSGPILDGVHKDRTQDSMATVVGDTTQDSLATVISSTREDDVPTVVGAQASDPTVADWTGDKRDGGVSNLDFCMVRSIVLVHAEVDLYVLQDETGVRP